MRGICSQNHETFIEKRSNGQEKGYSDLEAKQDVRLIIPHEYGFVHRCRCLK
jgi:hypothetical protein